MDPHGVPCFIPHGPETKDTASLQRKHANSILLGMVFKWVIEFILPQIHAWLFMVETAAWVQKVKRNSDRISFPSDFNFDDEARCG
jgi:hypothetical protein